MLYHDIAPPGLRCMVVIPSPHSAPGSGFRRSVALRAGLSTTPRLPALSRQALSGAEPTCAFRRYADRHAPVLSRQVPSGAEPTGALRCWADTRLSALGRHSSSGAGPTVAFRR